MKVQKNWIVVAILCAAWVIGVQAEVEEGQFTVNREGNRYSLEANTAPVKDILVQLAALIDIPLSVDESDEATVTANLEEVNLEKLIEGISEGYAIIYIKDSESGEYKIEKIIAAGAGEGQMSEISDGMMGSEEVVAAIMERARSVKRYHQKMKMSMSMMGQQQNMDGEMWMDGDKMYMKMTTPPFDQEQIIISDGKTTYTYMPMMKMVQTMDMEKLREAVGEDTGGMGGAAKIGQAPDPFDGVDKTTLEFVGIENINDEEVYVLEGGFISAVKEMQAMNPFAPDAARFWVSQKDGMPRKTTFYTKDGSEMMSQEYRDVVINPEIDPSKFVFEVPEDAQVVDMTDGIINMLNSSKDNPMGGGM